MNFLKSVFSEKSEVSMMRVMSIMSLATAIYLAVIGQNESVYIFVYAAFGGKAAQKYLEVKKSK